MSGFSFAMALLTCWVFASSGMAKLRAGRFASDLAGYGMLPSAWVGPLALVTPWIELSIGAALFAGFWPWVAASVAIGMLLLFTVGVVRNLLVGRRIACGCRGSDRSISWALVTSNLGLAGGLLVALLVGPVPVGPALFGESVGLQSADALAVVLTLLLCGVGVRLVGMWQSLQASMTTAVAAAHHMRVRP